MKNLKLIIKFLWIFFVIVTAISSCKKKSPENEEKEALINAINHINIDSKFSWVVVLPGLGCHGCIQEGEQFVKNHFKNKNIFFVLTKISSLKILQQKIGIKVQGQPNVFIDSNNAFDLPTDNRVYPIIISVKNGKLLEYEFQAPKNSAAFAKLDQLVVQSR